MVRSKWSLVFYQNERHYNPETDDVLLQENFLHLCNEVTGVSFRED